jgi:hypothetical protein
MSLSPSRLKTGEVPPGGVKRGFRGACSVPAERAGCGKPALFARSARVPP